MGLRTITQSVYRKNEVGSLDLEFREAEQYGKVKLGREYIFWKKGLKWYLERYDNISRAFRRIEAVDTKMCCGNVNFDIQKLVLILKDGNEAELLIGEGVPGEAEALYRKLQENRPEISYGKKAP
ncbi:MAG: hypothetical protein SOX32_01525 [Candidatus Choladocola sp.]|nr:hypothetical protein [Candidatus Choladocola sp.]